MNHFDKDCAANFEERNTFPGYPLYPPVNEYSSFGENRFVDDTNPEDFFIWKEPNWATGEWTAIKPGSENQKDGSGTEDPYPDLNFL